MKFRLTENYTYWWPVTVSQPDPEKPGKTVSSTFEVQFRALPRDRAKEIEEALRTAEQIQSGDFVDRMLPEVVQDWRQVEDEDGAPIPFSSAMLERMLQLAWRRDALMLAYAESLQGAKRKN